MAKKNGIGSHQSSKSKSTTYITPLPIIQALGSFDLDPCTPEIMPWKTATHRYTKKEDGLISPWFGRVWLNPPYGGPLVISPWLKKMADHINGITLISARTETKAWQEYIWPYADSILFIYDRIWFLNEQGQRGRSNSGAPSVLIAYDEKNSVSLAESGIKGRHLYNQSVPVIIVGISPSWQDVVKIAITRIGKAASVNQVYDMIETIAPDKVANNPNYKAKIRQKLQHCFEKIERGVYQINVF